MPTNFVDTDIAAPTPIAMARTEHNLEHNRVESGKRNRSPEREHNARYRHSK